MGIGDFFSSNKKEKLKARLIIEAINIYDDFNNKTVTPEILLERCKTLENEIQENSVRGVLDDDYFWFRHKIEKKVILNQIEEEKKRSTPEEIGRFID